MQGLLKRPGYRLYPPDSPEAGVLLAEQDLRPGRSRSGSRPPRTNGGQPQSAASSGSTRTGVFGTSRDGWHRDPPKAVTERFIPLLWLKVHELLGRVPEGSTARFVPDGTLPGHGQHSASVHRIAS